MKFNMKKNLLFTLMLILIACMFTGCSIHTSFTFRVDGDGVTTSIEVPGDLEMVPDEIVKDDRTMFNDKELSISNSKFEEFKKANNFGSVSAKVSFITPGTVGLDDGVDLFLYEYKYLKDKEIINDTYYVAVYFGPSGDEFVLVGAVTGKELHDIYGTETMISNYDIPEIAFCMESLNSYRERLKTN